MRFENLDLANFMQREGQLALVLGDAPAELEDIIAKIPQDDLEKDWVEVAYPSGLKAERIYVAKSASDMRELGAKLAASVKGEVAVFGADLEFAFGFGLRAYEFGGYKTEPKGIPSATFCNLAEDDFAEFQALIEGTHLTRNLVHEPSNVLTTSEFANRIEALRDLGVEVEILDEAALEKIGMRALLAVGQGSRAPSKVAIMKWQGGKGDPLVLVGKGVVFDTGGISIKPAAGMEDMTMDMGGAATVVGTIHALAKRKAKANVSGIVGLVENMPDGNAYRPGDIIKSHKGDTIEVLNTDAEGRLVLCDILWYAQENLKPKAMIDMATLTGAVIVALGHENAGVYGSHDEFTAKFIDAAKATGEGAWHMPLGKAYNKLIDGKLADVANTGGRWAGSITAAQFLKRFVKDDMEWIHLDIAGVALRSGDDPYAPKGASGWGVRALNRLVDDHFSS